MESNHNNTKITRTRGNVIIENIKVGDIHYEYDYGMVIKSEVIEAPVKDGTYWSWKSKHLSSDRVIDYGVDENHTHYSSKLYDYEAYSGMKEI